MKKIFLSVLIFCVVFLNAGCTKKSSDVTVVTTGLSFTSQIVFDSMEYTCFTEIAKLNKASFTFVEPREIEGLKVIFDKDKINAQYNGLNYELNDDFFAVTPFVMVYKILKDVPNSKKIKRDENLFSSSVDSLEYTVKVGQTGLPIEIKCPKENLVVNIKDCTILK